MKKREFSVLLMLVAIIMFVSFSYAQAQVDGDDGQPPVPSPEKPGDIPPLVGGAVPDRPVVFGEAVINRIDETSEMAINVWYGTNQKFGQIGNPQEWINILGNVSDLPPTGTLTYRLNNMGPEYPLSVGPNGERLENDGDFNVEIAYDELDPGNNEVVITASDGETQVQETVTVNYTTGQTWPTNYTADWGSSANIQNIAQVVDGYWQLSGDKVIIDTDNWGYDRLLAIGDETWTDYEATVPFTAYSLNPTGYASYGAGIGMIFNWQGHLSDAGEQPGSDWSRLGALGWYRWGTDNTEALELRNRQTRIGTSYAKVLEFGTPYMMKMSVISIPDDTDYYRLKIWKASEDEPFAWDLQGKTSSAASTAGSMLLIAHNVEADFGEVTINDLDTLRFNVDVEVNGSGTVEVEGEEGIYPDEQEDFGYAERVIFKAFPDEGHDFVGWSGDISGNKNPTTTPITKDMMVSAQFAPKPPTKLTVNVVGGGSVVKNPNKSEYLWGEEVTLTAIPDANQIFLNWDGDVTGINNPVTLKMNADKTVTAVFGNKAQASPKSDDFSECELDSGKWNIVNPAGDASFEVTGQAARFSIPAGTTHDMWAPNADALRLMQPTLDKNFEIEVKFLDLPTMRYQMEGILIQQDNNNWLRFDIYHDGSNLKANVARNLAGSTKILKSLPINPGGASNAYIRVARNANNWTYSYSFTGNEGDWIVFHDPIYEMTVNSSGIFVGNAGDSGSEPAFNARVDYFFNTAAPIVPEDAGNTVDVFVTGQGQVQVSPSKETYQCDEKVTLRATPADDWSFVGWSGDLSGNENPAELIIRGDYEITAEFGQGFSAFLPVVLRGR